MGRGGVDQEELVQEGLAGGTCSYMRPYPGTKRVFVANVACMNRALDYKSSVIGNVMVVDSGS